MAMLINLSATLEDYLRVMLRFQREKQFARVSDVASSLKVSRSAVTAALRSLEAKGLVNYQPYSPVTLSVKGKERARHLAFRHRVIADFLENVLAVSGEQAEKVACKMEHCVNTEILDCFVCFLAFAGRPRKNRMSWRAEFQRFMKKGVDARSCKYCVDEYLRGLNDKFK
jgi:DtxR family Mn-dependent transcriptional regulator